MTHTDDEIACFGPFRLSSSRRSIERGGVPLVLGDRALDILIALVEREGAVVSQRDLISRAWRGMVVGQGSLRVHISALRKALGEVEDGARYIENVTGQGYCFVARVHRERGSVSLAPRQEFQDGERKRLLLPPKLARMVGRDDIVNSIGHELLAERFVTVIGPGGMGKTTVAIAVAHALLKEFEGAACFIDVSPITDPKLVAVTLATSLGLAVQTDALQTLLDYLRPLRILLLLDNCEHVIDEIAEITETIYRETTNVHILATSREALRVEGEHVYWLPALPSPPPESSLKAAAVRNFAAVELFIERAIASGGRFELDDETAPIVAGICGRLDGMALAIELAAGRAGSYGIAATAELLNRNLGLDWHGRRTALPRHQTLNALLDWSYGLLAETNQRALCQLSVLVGAFDVEAAGAVIQGEAADENATLDILDALVSKSLVSVQPVADGSVGYRLLETTRLYAREKLVKSGHEETASQRHAKYFAKFMNLCHAGNIDLDHAGRTRVMRENLGNVRASLEWCFAWPDRDLEPGLKVTVAAAAVPVFFELSLLSEAYKWSEAGLAALDETARGTRSELVLRSIWAISSMWVRGSDDVMIDIERGMELVPADEPAFRLRLQATRHMVMTRKADFRGVLDAAMDWDTAARWTGDPKLLAISDLFLAIARHCLGDQAAARMHFEAGFERAASRNLQLCGMDQGVRGTVAYARVLWLSGHSERAVSTARRAVNTAVALGTPLNTCFALLFTTPVYLWCRDWDGAQEVLDRLFSHSHWQVLKPFHETAHAMQAATLIGRGEAAQGTALMLDLRGHMESECLNFLATLVATFTAEGLTVNGRPGEAVEIITQARRRAALGGDAMELPELLRLQAKALLAISVENQPRAEHLLKRSCLIARRQSALSWELRSAIDLARLCFARGDIRHARALLKPVFSRFTEGFQTHDLMAAADLLRRFDLAHDGGIQLGETDAAQLRAEPSTESQTSTSPR